MITYSGLKDVKEEEAFVIQELAEKHCIKITRKIPNASFHLSCKSTKKGEKNYYAFICRIEAPSVKWSVAAQDWDLRRALHKVLTHAEHRVQHNFKLEGKKTKTYKKTRNA